MQANRNWHRQRRMVIGMLAVSLATVVQADGVFRVEASAVNQTVSFDFSSYEQAAEVLSDVRLRDLLVGYNDGSNGGIGQASAADFRLDFRGLPMLFRFEQGSATLHLSIPELGITQAFSGATREESQRAFVDWFKTQSFAVNRIIEALVAVSPVDPIAGNPGSLMDMVMIDAFDLGLSEIGAIGGGRTGAGETPQPENAVGIGLEYDEIDTDMGAVRKTSMPITYNGTFGDPVKQYVLRAVLSTTEVEGSKSYTLPLTFAIRWPVTDNWTLTPVLTYAITGSEDLGSAAEMSAYFLTSGYVFRFDGFDLTLGNMVGKAEVLKTEYGDLSLDPDIANTVYRNGLLFSKPVRLFDDNKVLEVYWVNTQFSGTALYDEQQDQIGISIGPSRSEIGKKSEYRMGIKYTKSEHADAVGFDMSYWF